MSQYEDRRSVRKSEISKQDLGQGLYINNQGQIDIKLSQKSALSIASDGLTINIDDDTIALVAGSPYRIRALSSGTGSSDGSVALHHTTHEDGGTDEISVTGLSGLLADPQTPLNLTGPITSIGVATTIQPMVVTENNQILIDVTTWDVSVEQHGYAPKLPGVAGLFLNSSGAWGAPTASASVSQVEVDFGAMPIDQATFTITNALVSSTSRIIGQVAYEAPTDKELDELDGEAFDLKFAPGSGVFTLLMRALEGYVEGKFKINYIVGA